MKQAKRGRILRLKPGPLRRAVIIAIILVLVFGVGSVLSRIWTELLWYQEVGQTTVFWTPIWAGVAVGLAFAVIFFVIFFGSLYAARKISPRLLAVPGGPEGEVLELKSSRRWPGRLMLIVSVVIAIVVGIVYGSRWEQVFLFFNRGDFGYVDPVFGRDASFFVFTLPLWKMLVNFVGFTLLLTFVATAFVYVVDRAMVLNAKNRVSLAPHVKAHLSVILAAAMVAKAGDYMIQTWSLNLTQNAAVFGAGYTDVNARLPVLHFLAIVSLVAAAIFLANIRYRGWRLPAIAILIMALTWGIGGKAYPALVQQYRVSPNEIAAETPYIENNIEATRWAFGLNGMANVASSATDDLTADDIRANEDTIGNIRLWEPRPALSTYSQIQEIRLYYSFQDVDVDRYTIDGKFREVLLSVRELDQSQLQEQSRTWVNLHLTYTHGYGFVLSPVNEAGADGLPILMVKDIPPRTETDLKITRPEIYYGELGNDYVVVGTTSPEFDYPKGEGNAEATYAGDGGVSIDSTLRQVAFSFRFRTAKLLFSDSFTDDSRIMYRRTIAERVRALAPFLRYDSDPYMVVRDDGSLVWMWDAFTSSSRFPYSQPRADGTNYLRNPVKVVVDAYDGKVTFYQIDPDDPVANAWGGVYEGLFTPGERDARGPAPAHALSRGHVQGPGRSAHRLPHDESSDVLQQRGRLGDPHGDLRPRRDPGGSLLRGADPAHSDRAGVRAPAALRPLEQEEHGLPARGQAGRGELRQAGPARLPQRQARLRPFPGGGPHHQRSRRLGPDHALEPGRQRGDPGQSAGGAYRGHGHVLRAPVPTGFAEPLARVDTRDRELRGQSGHGADPG